MSVLTLEVNKNCVQDNTPLRFGITDVMITPPIDEDYWVFRVKVSDSQSIVAFPKFGVIGVGFAVEDDWNTNLPSSCGADEIYNHIKHNKGDDCITKDSCIKAIKMIQSYIETLEAAGNAS